MSRLKMSAALPSSHPAETSSQTAIHTRATERAKKNSYVCFITSIYWAISLALGVAGAVHSEGRNKVSYTIIAQAVSFLIPSKLEK